VERYFNVGLKLKWPNDLVTSDYQKCAGILCQTLGDYLIFGIGLNVGPLPEVFDREVFSLPEKGLRKDVPKLIYEFILKNRLNGDTVVKEFQNRCIHLNREVFIDRQKGIFRGLGSDGAALLETERGIQKVYSGSLFPVNPDL
jgi:BirA family biotin operon repressor/biotin-[acetyl-CoA-carboxylase] ligase